MPGPTFIEGKRVELKTVEEDDIGFLQRGRNHPSLRRFITDSPYNRVQTRKEFEQIDSDDSGINLLIVPSQGEFAGEPVGYVHIYPVYPKRRGGSIGTWLLPKAQRNKYIQDAMLHLIDYAFEQYGFRRLTTETVEKNKPVIRACERTGFTKEGTIREATFMDGEWVDMYRFGLLRSEFPGLDVACEHVFGSSSE